MPENPYAPGQAEPVLQPPALPFEKKPWNGWWTLLWAVIIFIAWQIVIIAGIFIALFSGGASSTDPEQLESALQNLQMDGDVAGLTVFATIFVVCPICWFIGRAKQGWSGWEYLGNGRLKWWYFPVWGVATLACSAVFGLLAPHLGITDPDPSMVKMAKSTQVPLFLYLGVGIGAPLVEEFMFRGTLWRGWRASKLGLWGTLILTSAAWASLHVQYPIVLIVYIFVLGLIMGWAREKTGSIWVPVFMHALNNGIATLQMLQLS